MVPGFGTGGRTANSGAMIGAGRISLVVSLEDDLPVDRGSFGPVLSDEASLGSSSCRTARRPPRPRPPMPVRL